MQGSPQKHVSDVLDLLHKYVSQTNLKFCYYMLATNVIERRIKSGFYAYY